MRDRKYYEVVTKLHSKRKLHRGQIELLKPLFLEHKSTFGQCGRNFGKTDGVNYALWRWAQENPGSENYYFAPYSTQAREILWENKRLEDYGPREWISDVNESELRITFHNGSFIKLAGSDNVEAYRGIKPRGLSVYDEFKDFRPEFHQAYDPNLVAHNSPLLIMGTPPDRECQFLEVAEEYRKDPNKHYYWGPTEINPHIPKDWLERKKRELFAKGESDVWEREYMARYVPGGVSKIFPMLDRSMVIEHDLLWRRHIHRDKKKLEWFITVDPGTTTTFAVLFSALNPYTKEWFFLDEIYETEQRLMTVDQIGLRITGMMDTLNERADWRLTYDEAAAWFQNEMTDRFDLSFMPTQKALRKKEVGLSVIKDAMLQQKVLISSRCTKLYFELDNYFKDRNGRIPKENDHLIDCMRYTFDGSYYSLSQEKEYSEERDENFRGARISDDFEGLDDFGFPTDEFGMKEY